MTYPAHLTRGSVQAYLDEISRYPLLTPVQEIELSRQIQESIQLNDLDPATLTPVQNRALKRGNLAKQKLMKSNLRLVVHIAKQYTRRLNGYGLELMDLVQEGAFGLSRAADMFDSTRGYKFSTYAYWWVKQAITRAIDTKDRAIRMPQHTLDKLHKATMYATRVMQETGKRPTFEQMAEYAGLDVNELQLYMHRAASHTSLDSLVQDTNSAIGDFIPDTNALEEQAEYLREDERERLLMLAFSCLDESQLDITKRRYGLDGKAPETLASIAKDMKVSRERVRQKLIVSINKMRRWIGASVA